MDANEDWGWEWMRKSERMDDVRRTEWWVGEEVVDEGDGDDVFDDRAPPPVPEESRGESWREAGRFKEFPSISNLHQSIDVRVC